MILSGFRGRRRRAWGGKEHGELQVGESLRRERDVLTKMASMRECRCEVGFRECVGGLRGRWTMSSLRNPTEKILA